LERDNDREVFFVRNHLRLAEQEVRAQGNQEVTEGRAVQAYQSEAKAGSKGERRMLITDAFGIIFLGLDGCIYQAFMYSGKWYVDELGLEILDQVYREK
jgi:hypothetical protein